MTKKSTDTYFMIILNDNVMDSVAYDHTRISKHISHTYKEITKTITVLNFITPNFVFMLTKFKKNIF